MNISNCYIMININKIQLDLFEKNTYDTKVIYF